MNVIEFKNVRKEFKDGDQIIQGLKESKVYRESLGS